MAVEYETMDYKGESMKKCLKIWKLNTGKNGLIIFPLRKLLIKIMEKYTDFFSCKRTIKVNLKKEKGYWLIDLNENEDFMVSLYSHGELYFCRY